MHSESQPHQLTDRHTSDWWHAVDFDLRHMLRQDYTSPTLDPDRCWTRHGSLVTIVFYTIHYHACCPTPAEQQSWLKKKFWLHQASQDPSTERYTPVLTNHLHFAPGLPKGSFLKCAAGIHQADSWMSFRGHG